MVNSLPLDDFTIQ